VRGVVRACCCCYILLSAESQPQVQEKEEDLDDEFSSQILVLKAAGEDQRLEGDEELIGKQYSHQYQTYQLRQSVRNGVLISSTNNH